MNDFAPLARAAELARSFLATLPARPVRESGSLADLRRAIASLARAREAWLHVDGAFGLWAAASPAHHHLTAGVAGADSWASDGHKWLNVPYDSGFAIVKDAAVHRAAMSICAAYLVAGDAGRPAALDWLPRLSRRARGFAVYAALRSLGRQGAAELVERCCALARRMAGGLRAAPGVEIR